MRHRASPRRNSTILNATVPLHRIAWQNLTHAARHSASPLPCSAVPRQAKGHRTLPLRWLTEQSNAKLYPTLTEPSITAPAPRATLPCRRNTQRTAMPTHNHTQPNPACAKHGYSPSLSQFTGLLASHRVTVDARKTFSLPVAQVQLSLHR